ncbi:MAG TPA: hypothetical protein VNT26_20575, partial [Candidatus Sulfotelmatobacter sp.]|nr:hypothetical protein [Candidatus Sulfotelmatobacter sp.]
DPQTNVSVTELEFNEARADRPDKILVYRKSGVEMEPRQKAFAQRVEDFESGYFRRPPFTSAQQLADWVRQDIMAWLAEQATKTSVGGAAKSHEDTVAVVQAQRSTWKPGFGQGPWVGMCLVPISAKLPLTPYHLGDSNFQRKLRLLALQSEPELFNPSFGTHVDVDEQTVRLWQEHGHRNTAGEVCISLDGPLTIRLSTDLPSEGNRDWIRSFYADPEAIHRALTAAVIFSTNLFAQLGGALPNQAAVGAALGGMHMRSLAKPPVQSSGGVTIPTVDLPDPLLAPTRPEVRSWLELSSKADTVAQQWVELMNRAYARAKRGG